MAKATAKNIDFSGVKDRGAFNPKQVAEGDYAAIVTKVEDVQAKDDSDMYVFTVKLEKFSQHAYPYYCKIQENQLWKLRNLAVAAGLNVPKARTKFDPNKIVGKKIGVTMQDDEYEGKMKSVVEAVFPASELAEGAEIESDDSDESEFEAGGPVTATDDDFDPEDEAGAEEKPKSKKDKGDKKKGKKGKKGKGEVEDLDISDV